MSVFGLDRLFGSFEVIAGLNDTVRLYNPAGGGGVLSYTMPPGDYYLTLDETALISPVVLFKSIYQRINAAVGQTLVWAYATPTESQLGATGGIRLVSATGDVELRVNEMHASWRPVFGLKPIGAIPSIGAGFISPYELGHQVVFNRPALSKFRDIQHEQYRTGRGRESYQYRWATDTVRRLVYSRIPAAQVRASRASEQAGWADAAGRRLGDTNASWQAVWQAWSQGKPGVILHDVGFQNLSVTSSPHEIVLLSQEQRDVFSSTWTSITPRQELYRLELEVEVLDANNYEHD